MAYAYSISHDLRTPLGDMLLIEHILTNLVDKTLKYQNARDLPQINITAERRDDHVDICVSDNGIGIASEYQEMVFNLFQRLHTETEYPGTGIGRAIAAKSTGLMNSTLAVASAPGAGSIFALRLRAAALPDRPTGST